MKSAERFTTNVIHIIKTAIEEAEGQEVLCVGQINEEKKIHEVEAVARGNDVSAPAIYPFMERGDVVIHNHPSGVLKPSGADIQVASTLGNQGIGFYIVDNKVNRVYCVSEPVIHPPEEKLEEESLADIIRPDGLLQSFFPSYESREPQISMLKAVARAFNDRLLSVIEAGTGVGKSLAYLIPAASWAVHNKERVIVSTATINLQQQLIDKDIPLVEKLLKVRLNAKLVKGRGNYVCLRRLEDAQEEMALFSDLKNELAAIKKWAAQTKTGSKDDLSFFPTQEVWSLVRSEADACMGLRCPFREECFVLRARKEAAYSNLLVVNHHLLFSDLAARVEGAGFDATAVLPPAHRIVFDEAHSLEESATSFFSEIYNKLMFFKQIRRLYHHRGRRAFGLSLHLQKLSDKPEIFEKIPKLVQALHGKAEELDTQLQNFLGPDHSYWLRRESRPEDLISILEPIKALRAEMSKLLSALEAGFTTIDEKYEKESELFEAGIIQDRLASFSSVLAAIETYMEQDDSVCWIEKKYTSKREAYCSLIKTPLKIAPLMQDAVFEPHKTVVSTSATLTVKKQFDFWLNRVGLNGSFRDRTATLQLESPFEYRKQVLLAVPIDAPEPKQEGYQEYVNNFVQQSIEISEGSALVLFTSYRMLQESYESVAPELEKLGISVLKQGSDDRSRLLQRFHSDVSSVLMATNSFWEGVDAPGESLKLVIICRLPFSVPTDPVIQARMEAVEREGGNSFFQFSLPQAAMRLRQGFGRLMRRKSDHGVVAILDSRIVRKGYGKILLQSLPETGHKIAEGKQVLQSIEDFFYQATGDMEG